MPLLLMRDIDKAFLGKPAIQATTFEVKEGEIHALLGENGAGKTTLMNILYGIYSRDAGEIFWKDKLVEFRSPKDAINCHIGMVHQHFMLVPTLTVAENITLGLKMKDYPFVKQKWREESILNVSKKYGLDINPHDMISNLSVGEQQRVEIIKTLYRDAKLLILDEPTAVLTPQEIQNFFDILQKLKSDGHSIIIITHKIPEIMSITDRISILRDGKMISTVNTKDVDATRLSQLMIGRDLKPIRYTNINTNTHNKLTLKKVSLKENNVNKLCDVSFSIMQGEIFGIAGVDGNGQKELAESIMGIRAIDQGKILMDDESMEKNNVFQRKQKGIAYISDDRHHDGLIMDMNLNENTLLKMRREQRFLKNGILQSNAVCEYTQKMVNDYDIKTPSLDVPIRYLSGGNQQKLILAREIADMPQIIVAFQPTRGLDIGATEFIQQKLLHCRAKGCSILLISADLDEILTLSDKVAVIYEGRIMGILQNNAKMNVSQIGLMMAGQSSTKGDTA